jgi:hypothetical protein
MRRCKSRQQPRLKLRQDRRHETLEIHTPSWAEPLDAAAVLLAQASFAAARAAVVSPQAASITCWAPAPSFLQNARRANSFRP